MDQWAAISRRPIVVELWQSHHFRGGDFWPNATEKCRGDVDCVFVRSLKPKCFDEADAVVFNGALVDGIPNSKGNSGGGSSFFLSSTTTSHPLGL